MALTPGTRLGVYEITAPIGEGGMGQVYRAHDTRLNRDVALKVLPAAVANDPDRLARFEREAQTLAALNHPNIAHIHGLEESDGVRALVMELVEGEDLAQRTVRGPIPLDETLAIAKQIAEALEAAHEQGIIHRDLKPANIKVRADGTVKVLDFGLAKAIERAGEASRPGGASDRPGSPAQPAFTSPTLTSPAQMTGVGVILGTAAYMSPEQARGRRVDKRADIWAFGVVVFEMLTGTSLFTGEDMAEVLASVVKESPSLDRLPPQTPTALRRLLARCLTRDPLKRLRDIGEARVLLEDLPPEDTSAPVTRSSRSGTVGWIASALLAVGLVAVSVAFLRQRPVPDDGLGLSIALPENSSVASLALSPDGRRLAIALNSEGKRQLWLRTLDAPQLQLLPDTQPAQYPFWSPDSRFIGFLSMGNLKVIPATGGPSQILSDGANGGGTWNRDGVILFSSEAGPIRRVSATGGASSPVTQTEAGVSHGFPVFLPDGNHILYLVSGPDKAKTGVYLAALDSPSSARRVLADQSSVIYARRSNGAPDHLLFIRDGSLVAQPFDATTLQLDGDVVRVASKASFSATGSQRQVAASTSNNGRLVFLGDRTLDSELAWVDRSGREIEPVVRGEQRTVALSPDEKTVALGSLEALWLRDLTRGVETRLTFPPRGGSGPVWSPDGTHIAYGEGNALYVKEANGTGAEARLLQSTHLEVPSDWSRDGRSLLYTEVDPKTRADLWILSDTLAQSEHAAPVKFLATEFNESQGQFSPDGHWIAYVSDESGDDEVYVRPYPPGPGKWRVSRNRANEPRWRRDGKELFFMEGSARYTWTAVPIQAASGGTLQIGEPKPLFAFESFTNVTANSLFVYSPAADGQRFLVNSRRNSSLGTLNVMTNWERVATATGTK